MQPVRSRCLFLSDGSISGHSGSATPKDLCYFWKHRSDVAPRQKSKWVGPDPKPGDRASLFGPPIGLRYVFSHEKRDRILRISCGPCNDSGMRATSSTLMDCNCSKCAHLVRRCLVYIYICEVHSCFTSHRLSSFDSMLPTSFASLPKGFSLYEVNDKSYTGVTLAETFDKTQKHLHAYVLTYNGNTVYVFNITLILADFSEPSFCNSLFVKSKALRKPTAGNLAYARFCQRWTPISLCAQVISLQNGWIPHPAYGTLSTGAFDFLTSILIHYPSSRNDTAGCGGGIRDQ